MARSTEIFNSSTFTQNHQHQLPVYCLKFEGHRHINRKCKVIIKITIIIIISCHQGSDHLCINVESKMKEKTKNENRNL